MAFYDKYIPNELKEGVDEILDFGSSVVEKGITKPFASISDKLIPNELRFLAPYAAGIGTLMLPPGMSMMTRALLASMMNAGGQIAADESATGELSDLNKISMAIAGGLGALGADPSQGSSQGAAGATTPDGRSLREVMTSNDAYSGAAKPEMLAPAKIGIPAAAPNVQPGFFEGVGNVGKKGLEVAQDYVRGTRSDLAGFGKDPGSLFEYNKLGKVLKGQSPLPGLTKAAGALAPTLSLGTADVAYEAAIDAQKLCDETEAAEMAEAGASIDEIQNARRIAIREAMESAQFTDQDILDTLAEIGLKDGGIASLKNGGILGFGNGGIADVDFTELVSKLREEGFSQQEAIEEATRQLSENMAQGGTKEIFERDTPLSEDLLGMSDGFTLSPVTLLRRYMAKKELENRANGGIIGLKDGGMLDLGGNEMDYRGGGFIPMGSKERADDVPARLSKNEFVMTADAVRAAGGGSVNKGAQRMYDIMNRLEARA